MSSVEVVVPCADFPSALAYFTDQLGFKVKLIFPADDPVLAVVQGRGVTLRLDRNAEGPSPLLRFTKTNSEPARSDASTITPPEGIRIEWVEDIRDEELVLPDLVPSFVLTLHSGDGSGGGWVEGRAGMLYRDLVPDRQGGRFICSHIKILDGGAVPDYVHHHHVHFQMLYCLNGWVDVVYEDQGPPFRMTAGDCVLQPPHIRHRVLQCSPGLEVIEVSSPAQHNTMGDAELDLPTAVLRPDRLFSGQRFARYQCEKAKWQPMEQTPNWEQSNTGLDVATGGLGGAIVLKPSGSESGTDLNLKSSSEFVFRFVIRGSVDLQYEEKASSIMTKQRLNAGDAFVIPRRMSARLAHSAADTQILEVSLPV